MIMTNNHNLPNGSGEKECQPAPSGMSNFDADANVSSPDPIPNTIYVPLAVKPEPMLVYLLSVFVRLEYALGGDDSDKRFRKYFRNHIRNSVLKVCEVIIDYINRTLHGVENYPVRRACRRDLEKHLLDVIAQEAGQAAGERFASTIKEYGEDELPADFAKNAKGTVEYFDRGIRPYRTSIMSGEDRSQYMFPQHYNTPVVREWLQNNDAVADSAAHGYSELVNRINEGFPGWLDSFFKNMKDKKIPAGRRKELVSGIMGHLAKSPFSAAILVPVIESCSNGETTKSSADDQDNDLMKLTSVAFKGRVDGVFNDLIAVGAMVYTREIKVRSNVPLEKSGSKVVDMLTDEVAATAFVNEYIIGKNPTGEEFLQYVSEGLRDYVGVGLLGSAWDNACKALKKAGVLDKPIVNRMGLYRLNECGYKKEEITDELKARLKNEKSEDCVHGLVCYVNNKVAALRNRFFDEGNADSPAEDNRLTDRS